jgi:hypothetical protein
MRRLIILGAAVAAILIVEEATKGRLLGQGPAACQAIGGKPAIGRCVTPVCYWQGDCGQWVNPTRWLDRVKPGDPISKVVFWLGDPLKRDGEYFSWSCGKPSSHTFRAVIRDDRLVEVEQCEPD